MSARASIGSALRSDTALLALLLGAAAAHGLWNAWRIPPLAGYDAAGHAAYVLHIARTGSLPDPLSGWSSFHPPLYYVVGAGVWKALEPLGGHALSAGLRSIGLVAWLAAAAAAFRVLRRSGVALAVAGTATALLLFVPAAQMASAMVGNEALGAAFAALTLLPVLRLQQDPRDRRAALAAGLGAGCALATKYTGIWLAAAALVPYLRRDLDAQARRGLALLLVAMAVVAGPVYLRNLALTGSPVPMTREREPMKSVEAALSQRPRQLADYLSLPPACVLRPSIYQAASGPSNRWDRNRAMTSVWGVAYASTWWDAFGHWIRPGSSSPAARLAPYVALLGLVPTGIALLGFLGACSAAFRRRLRSAESPLVVMAVAGLVTFVAFTVRAPSMSAAKGSYLLPLALPAAVFFARGLERLAGGRRWLRVTLLGLSLAAALGAAGALTSGWAFRPAPARTFRLGWLYYAAQMPDSGLAEAVDALSPP